MKKRVILIIICVVIVAALILVCSKLNLINSDNDTDNTQNEDNEPDQVICITTPYADLYVPAEFEGNVINEVISEDPYILKFKTVSDNIELFDISFNGSGDILVGTLVNENENTVIYMDLPELDRENENYDIYEQYQSGINTIISHLVSDYEFYVDLIIESGSNDLLSVETEYVTIHYPAKWQDKVQIIYEDDSVQFINNGTPLFDLVFKECDGFLLGTYKDTPIYIIEYKIETDEQAAMKNDVNVILQYLMEDSNFVINM